MAIAAEVTPRYLYAEYGHTVTIHPAEDENADVLFERVCTDFENTKIEQDAEGDIRILAPVGGESGYQNSQLTAQLVRWAEQDGRGRAFDSSVGFILPDGSKLSPDGSWVSLEKLKMLSYDQRREFLRIAPDSSRKLSRLPTVGRSCRPRCNVHPQWGRVRMANPSR